MAGDTSEQTSSSSEISDSTEIDQIKDAVRKQTIDMVQNLRRSRDVKHSDKISARLHVQILEEPLTAQNLSTIIAGITDLHIRCWLIQQNRLGDLMDYAQSRDPRFLKEANLQVGIMTNNSPALIDFLISSGGGIAGAGVLALALKTAIDAVVQAPLRYQATKLKNDKEALEQKIREQEAQQKQKIAAQKAQLEIERKQVELDRQLLELQKDRVKITIEIATTMVGQLQSDLSAGQREMIIHALVPPLLQLAATDGLRVMLPPLQTNKEPTENK